MKRNPVDNVRRRILRRASNTVAGLFAGALLSAQALAGGVDVSSDEIYSDGVTLTTFDGQPLDINGDGNVDLAVASNRGGFAERSRYYLGNGDGTFSVGDDLVGGASSEIAAADLNGDMFVDLVQGQRDLTDKLHLNNQVDGLNAGTDITADTTRTLSVVIGDLDGDTDLDVVTGNGRLGGSVANPPQPNLYYLNDGAGTFSSAEISTDADDTRGIALADIDGDGKLDVIAGNDETTAGSNRVYLNQTTGGAVAFAAGFDFGPADDQTSQILVGDLNIDGKPDIVTINHFNGPSPGINRFFINASTVGVLDLGTGNDVSADAEGSSGGVLADFDNDTDLDLAIANLLPTDAGQTGRNRLYLNQFIENGSTTVSFAAGIDISADVHKSRSIAAVDLNGDSFIDIVVGNEDDVAGVRDRRYLNNGTANPFANVAPVIDSQVTTPLATDEQTAVTIVIDDVAVTDPDNVFPADFTLTVQAGTNYTFTGNTITPDANFDGDLAVPVIVNDGTDDSAAFDLTVTVNDTQNAAPAFTSTAVTSATEGVTYTYDITTSDPDINDMVAITAPTLPGWLTFTDNGDGTASLTGTPGAGDVGDHNASLQASDDAASPASAPQDFTISVAPAGGGNNPPTFTSTAVTNATEGEGYTYNVTAEDEDGDSLAIMAPTLPAWLTLTDNDDGTATLTGTPAGTDVGDHDVTLEVSDGTDAATQSFTVTVEAAPQPPPPPPPSGGGGGGSLGLVSLLMLLAYAVAFRLRETSIR